MAIALKSLEAVDRLNVEHKGVEFDFKYEKNGKTYAPFAFARVINKEPLLPMTKGNKIGFKPTLRDNQRAPVLNVKQKLETSGHCLIGLDCGDGKTIVAAKIISDYSPMRTLIVTHRKGIREQITKALEAETGQPVWEAIKPEEVSLEARIITCTIKKLPKIPFIIRSNIDLMIVDECDCVCSREYGPLLLRITPKRLIGMTYTFADCKTGIQYRPLELLYGTMPITSATHKPYKVIRINTKWKPTEKMFWCWKKKKQRINWHLVTSSLGTNYERNAYIAEITKYFLDSNPENKICILRKEKRFIEPQMEPKKRKKKETSEEEQEVKRLLSNKPRKKPPAKKKEKEEIPYEQKLKDSLHIHLEKIYPDYQRVYGIKPKVKNARVFVGTYSKMGAAFDIKTLEGFDNLNINVVFFADDVEDCRQASGRGKRSETFTVIELIDDNSILRGHAAKREKMHKDNGATKVITVNQEDIEWIVEDKKKKIKHQIKTPKKSSIKSPTVKKRIK